MTPSFASSSPSISYGNVSMEVDRVRFHPLSIAQHQHRRDNHLCLYCGSPGHLIHSCPTKGDRKTQHHANSVCTPQKTGKRKCSGHQSCHGSNQPASSSSRFTVLVDLQFVSTTFRTIALLDSGATSYFMDITFARTWRILVVQNTIPISVEVVDGRFLSFGATKEATTS